MTWQVQPGVLRASLVAKIRCLEDGGPGSPPALPPERDATARSAAGGSSSAPSAPDPAAAHREPAPSASAARRSRR